MDPFLIRSTTERVVKHAKDVRIVPGALKKAAKLLERSPFVPSEEAYSAQRVFLMDCVNFCFWAGKGEEKWKVEYPKGTVRDGWDALVASFDRAIDEGVPVLEASYLADASVRDAGHIFRSSNGTEIPLLEERIRNLNEAGSVLTKRFERTFENVLDKAGNRAEDILRLIITHFPSFEDCSIYKGSPVYFYKRAQIAVLDLAVLARIPVSGMEVLTACADYKLPQILHSLGILDYSEALESHIASLKPIEKGSEEEVEIRAATVGAVELLAKTIGKTPAETDNLLWHIAAKNEFPMSSYHRTLTTSY